MRILFIICMLGISSARSAELPTKREVITEKRDTITGIGLMILAALTAGLIVTTSHK